MKKLLTFIYMVCLAMAVHSQGMTLQNEEKTDSTISVISYFCKNDTMEYQRTHGKMKIVDNDTTVTSSTIEKFMIVVTDSTSNGYEMELIPVSFEVEDDTNDFQSTLSKLLWEDYKNVHCRFTTDELGCVQHIQNWREIRDMLKKNYKTVFDSLYTSMPMMDSIMPRKQLENLLILGSSTEDGVKEQYDELDILFGLHGNQVTMEPVESDDVTEAGYPIHSCIESFYPAPQDEYDCEGDYVVQARTDTKLTGDDAKDLLGSTLGVIFNQEMTDSIDKYMNEALQDKKEGLTTTCYEKYCYFFNGWPKLMQKIEEVNLGDIVKRVSFDSIEWTSRRWETYH